MSCKEQQKLPGNEEIVQKQSPVKLSSSFVRVSKETRKNEHGIDTRPHFRVNWLRKKVVHTFINEAGGHVLARRIKLNVIGRSQRTRARHNKVKQICLIV